MTAEHQRPAPAPCTGAEAYLTQGPVEGLPDWFRVQRRADGMPGLLRRLGPQTDGQPPLDWTLSAELPHPAFLRPLDLLTDAAAPAAIWQNPGGELLATVLRAGPLPLGDVLDIAVQAVEALAVLHGAQILHRNISPGALLWSATDRRLTMLGLEAAARVTREDASGQPWLGRRSDLAFIAPEQTGRFNRLIDYRTDFYALGATLYAALAGRPPFDSSDPLELVHSHIARAVTPVQTWNAEVPSAVSDILMRLLAKDPDQRYQSHSGLRKDLKLCRSLWSATGRIQDFQVGARDVRPTLRMPQTLYGRDGELGVLRWALRHASRGEPQLIYVQGGSGLGKSALVGELMADIQARQGHFATGKFEPLTRDIPYGAVRAAFTALVRDMLSADGDTQRSWLAQLRDAAGADAALLAQLVPDLGAVLEPAAEPQSLGLDEARQRLADAFARFALSFTRAGRPLVLFLDDLQWADPGSLSLIEALFAGGDRMAVMLICTYRDDEVGPEHPLRQTQDRLMARGVQARSVAVGPLTTEAVEQLLIDALQAAPAEVRSLAVHLAARCRGNPFLLGQQLQKLERVGLIRFDPAADQWSWDQDRIEAQEIEGAEVDIVLNRLEDLPPQTRTMLSVAACVGGVPTLSSLVDAADSTPAEVEAALLPAVQAGLMLPLAGALETGLRRDGRRYRFTHDRVSQAAYARLSAEEAAAAHHRIGRILLDQGRAAGRDGLLSVVNHWNKARARLDAADRARLAALNFEAARAARSSSALSAALSYLEAGLSLLPDTGWTDQYATMFDAHRQALEIAVTLNDASAVDRYAAAADARAANLLDRSVVKEMRARLALSRGDVLGALDIGRAALADLGEPVPATVSTARLLAEFALTQAALGRTGPEELAARPAVEDPRLLAVSRIITQSATPAVVTGQRNLYTLFTFRMMRLMARHGSVPSSAFHLMNMAIIMGHGFRRMAVGRRFGDAALVADAQPGSDRALSGTVRFCYEVYVRAWIERTDRMVPRLVETLVESSRIGDATTALYATNHILFQRLLAGNAPEAIRTAALEYLRTADRTGRRYTAVLNDVLVWLLDALTGREPGGLDAAWTRIEALVPRWEAENQSMVVAFANVLTAYVAAQMGRADLAARHLLAYWSARESLSGIFSHNAMAAVAAAAALAGGQEVTGEQRRAVQSHARTLLRLLGWAAGNGPEADPFLRDLLAGALALSRGQALKARRALGAALTAAERAGRLPDEGLAARLGAAAAAAADDDAAEAALLLRAALAARRWGAAPAAAALVEQVRRRQPDLAALAAAAGDGASSPENMGGALDTATVIRASQAVSRNIVLSELITAVMETVIANAGATRGCLILPKGEVWVIEGEAVVGAERIATMESRPALVDPPVLVRDVVTRTLATGAAVIVHDALHEPGLAQDPYVAQAQPRALLGLPLVNRSSMTGMLYLENAMAAGVFGADRLELLKLVAAQAAVSIENARLYQGLEQLNRTLEQQVASRTQELVEQSRIVRTTLASMSDGIAAFDAAGRLQFWNDRAIALLGVDPPLWRKGTALQSIFSSLPAQFAAAETGGALPDGDKGEAEMPNGRIIQMRSSPMPDGGTVQVYLDVTEERRRERELAAANQHILAQQARMVQQEKQAALGQLVAGVAHEINTPLGNAITSTTYMAEEVAALAAALGANVMKRSALSEFLSTSGTALRHVHTNLERAAEMVDRFKRLSAEQSTGDRRTVDVMRALADMVDGLRPATAAANCRVVLDGPPELEACLELGALLQVATNLIQNALTHAFAGVAAPEIQITAAATDRGLNITVADNGVGMSDEVRRLAFEPFFTTRRGRGSAGIGLSIVANVVATVLEGTLDLDTEPGGGTRCHLTIPCNPPPSR